MSDHEKMDEIIRRLESIDTNIKNLDVMSHRFLHYMQVAPRFSKLNDEKIFSFKHGNRHIHMWLPNADLDYIQGTILLTSTFFEENILNQVKKRFLRPGMNIVEVGGNIGNHTVYFSSICKAASMHVFEPNRDVYEILVRNISLNGCENVTAVRAAVADRCGNGSVSVRNMQNLGGTQVSFDEEGDFPFVSLDSIPNLSPDFIKIDVEGMALNVLQGSMSVISRSKPIVMIELWSAEVAPARKMMEEIGYKLECNFGDDYFFVV